MRTPSGVDRETTTAVDAHLDDPADPRTVTSFVITETTGSATATSSWDRSTLTLAVSDRAGVTSSTRFDPRGDVVAVEAPGRAPFSIGYDGRGRPTAVSDGDRHTGLAWDDQRGEVAITDSLGGVTRLSTDRAHRPSALIRPDGTRITIDRSTAGDPIATRVNGEQVLSQSWSPTADLLTSGFGSGLELDVRELGADGLTSVVHRPDGDVVPRYEAGVLVGVELPDGTLSVERDSATGAVSRIEDTTGLVTEPIVDEGAVVGVRRRGPVDADVRWEVDGAGRVTELTVEAAGDAASVDYRYDEAGRLVGADDLTVGYDDAGRVATTEIGVLRSERGYDDHGQLVDERHVTAAGPVYEARYAYDLLGRMTTRSTSDAGAAPQTTTYQYDTAGRLTSAAVDGAPAYSYAYDGLDRLTSITTPAGTEVVTYGGDGRVATRGDTAYAWSASGNLQSIKSPAGTTTVETDLLGRLRSARPANGADVGYVLDEDGNIAERDKDGVSQRFVYDDAGRIVAELGPDGKIVRRYVYEGGPFAALVITDQGTYRIIRDAAGNPIGAIDVATGQRVQTIEYDPMGRETRKGSGVVPFGYLDGLPDPATGIVLPTRLPGYDPGTGGPVTNVPVWNPVGGQPAAPGGAGAAGGGSGGAGGGGAGGGLSGIVGPGLAPLGGIAYGDPGGGSALGASAAAARPGLLDTLGNTVGDYVSGLFGSNDFRGTLYEGLGLVAGELGHLATGLQGRVTGLGGTFLGLVGLGESLYELSNEAPAIFEPVTEGSPNNTGLLLKSIGSVLAIIPSLYGIYGNVFGVSALAVPAFIEALAVAAVLAGAAYLVYEFGRVAGWWGDPHLKTVDGLTYDFQAVGEFVAARPADGSFEVQLRTAPLEDERRISVVSAVVARIGGARVTITSGAEVPLRVDGVPVDLPFGGVDLAGGGRVDRAVGGEYVVVAADRTVGLVLSRYGGALNVELGLSERYDGQLVGLAGDADGSPEGDLRARDGTVVEPVPGTFTAPLYSVFGDSWRVTPEESLFDYDPGTSTATYTDREYPSAVASVDTLDAAVRDRAEQLCGGAGLEAAYLDACTLDVGLTGDTGFVSASVAAQAASAAPSAAPVAAPGDATEIAVGDTIEGTLDGDDDVDRYSFSGDEGDVVLVVMAAEPPCAPVSVAISASGGAAIAVGVGCGGLRFELPRDGEYQVDVRNPSGGSYRFEFLRAPKPDVETVRIGDEVSGTLDEPGERHEYTFDVAANTALYFGAEGPCEVQLQIVDPDDALLVNAGACLQVGRVLFPNAGRHRVRVSAPVTFTGAYGFSILQSSVDERFEISVGDEVGPGRPSAGAGVIDRPGAVDVYVFNGRAGEVLTVGGGSEPGCYSLRPMADGDWLQGLLSTCGQWTFTVAEDGLVEIYVNGADRPVGEYSFTLARA